MIAVLTKCNLDFIYSYDKIKDPYEAKRYQMLIAEASLITELEIKEILVFTPKLKIFIFDENYNTDTEIALLNAGVDYYTSLENISNKSRALIANFDKKYNVLSKMSIDYDLNIVVINNCKIKLAPKELKIFEYLVNHRGQLCSRKKMLVDVLGYHEEIDSRIIDVYVKHLRTKLSKEGTKIKTIRGKGYVYEF